MQLTGFGSGHCLPRKSPQHLVGTEEKQGKYRTSHHPATIRNRQRYGVNRYTILLGFQIRSHTLIYCKNNTCNENMDYTFVKSYSHDISNILLTHIVDGTKFLGNLSAHAGIFNAARNSCSIEEGKELTVRLCLPKYEGICGERRYSCTHS